MSDERQASRTAANLVWASVTARVAEDPDYAAQQDRRLLDYIADLEADRALLEAACGYYVAADFAYPQYEGSTCLILALPEGERAGADLRKTLSSASSPLAPTQEGAT